jgi:hypothetical protein
MILIETATIDAIIARLKSFLPAKMTESVIPYPDRPEEMTKDVLTAKHPDGAFLMKYIESESAGSEVMIFGVYVLAEGLVQTSKLTRAAKVIVNGLAPFSGHKLTLHKDQEIKEEGGVVLRCITFALPNPTMPLSDSKIAAKIAELEI